MFTIISEGKDISELNDKVYNKNGIVILDEDVDQNKKILIQDMKGDALKGKQLIITAAGLEHSLRRLRDGCTYFGVNKTYGGMIINYFILNSSVTEEEDKSLFFIFFDRNIRKYFIKSISRAKVYIMLSEKKWTPIDFSTQNQFFFPIGKDIIYLELVNKELKVTIYNELNKSYTFSQSEEITIGRNKLCSVQILSSILSKINTVIRYNSSHWEIIDGHKGKASTNGTWMLCDSKYELLNGTEEDIVKIGNNNIIKISSYADYQSSFIDY